MSNYLRINHLSDVPHQTPTFVAIGSFDGVHLGHQEILKQMVAAARAAAARPAVLTFFPHPKRVLQEMSQPYYIATLDDRVAWIGEQGVELIITHPFDETVRTTRAADFVAQLCRHLHMQQLWGGNFSLGYQREGDAPFLRRLGQEMGYSVAVVTSMVRYEGEVVSSSRIRRHLQAGEVASANGCLGRPYRLRGVVVQGNRRGHTIGFPTANLAYWEEQLLPAHGVYATIAWLDETPYVAATNVGVRPTVDGVHLTVEAHLLDFTGDLYGRELCLEFISHIRAEKKFNGLDELKAQIDADVAQVRAILRGSMGQLRGA